MSTIKPSDVFTVDVVRPAYRDAVKSLLDKHCVSKEDRLVGTMATNKFARHWKLPSGTASFTPAFWGSPAHFYVFEEAARAWVLQLLGADLSRSRTYSKYLPAPAASRKRPVATQWIVGEKFLGLGKGYEYSVFTVVQLTKAPESWQIASEPFDRRADAVAQKEQLEADRRQAEAGRESYLDSRDRG